MLWHLSDDGYSTYYVITYGAKRRRPKIEILNYLVVCVECFIPSKQVTEVRYIYNGSACTVLSSVRVNAESLK